MKVDGTSEYEVTSLPWFGEHLVLRPRLLNFAYLTP